MFDKSNTKQPKHLFNSLLLFRFTIFETILLVKKSNKISKRKQYQPTVQNNKPEVIFLTF